MSFKSFSWCILSHVLCGNALPQLSHAGAALRATPHQPWCSSPLQALSGALLAGFLIAHSLKHYSFFFSKKTSKHGNNWGNYLEIKSDLSGHFINTSLSSAESNWPWPSRITSRNKGLNPASVWPSPKCLCLAFGRAEEHQNTARLLSSELQP